MDEISLASYRASVATLLARCFADWKPIPPEVWAEEVRRMKGGLRFRWAYAPYLRGMFLSIFDPSTTETILELFSRAGKSEVILNAIGYTMDQAPRRILSMWPKLGDAEKWSKDVLAGELIETTSCLTDILGNSSGRRLAYNTILHKVFPGGLITIFGANSPGDMRRAKGSFLYADEIDAIESEATDEGDQLAIFGKRGDEYADCIRVFASYPSVLGASKIHAKIEDSDWQQWFVTCPACGGDPFVMHRRMLRYDKAAPERCRMECPQCHDLLTDAQRHGMMLAGKWTPTRPFKGKRGFQANAMLWPHPVDAAKYPGGFLQMAAQQEIDAANSEDPKRSMRVIVNTFDAEPFDPTEENEKPPDWKPIYDRREKYGLIIPKGGLFLSAFVDCQKNRLEVGWRAWGRREESWGMDHVVIDGYIGHPQVWRELRRQLARKWTHASRAEMHLGMGFIDGGAYAEDVYRFFQGLARNPEPHVTGHCQASKGMGTHPHPIVTHGKLNTVAKVLKGRYIGTWQAKDRIYERLRMIPEPDDAREGIMHFNERYAEEFFRGLTIETATQKINGAEIYNTYKDEVTGNEPLDIEVGCFAAVRLHPRNWDMLEDALVPPEQRPAKKPRMMAVSGALY